MGAYNFKDITGQRFNKLVVLRKSGLGKFRQTIWLCQCDCGNTKEVSRANLMRGQKTCGKCIWIDRRIGAIAVENKVLGRYKHGAKNRDLSWELSDSHAFELIKSSCHYCGIVDVKINESTKEKFPINGIDRIDSSKGYVSGNVVSCCRRCNIAKSDMPYEEFLEWIHRVYKYRIGTVNNGLRLLTTD